MPTWYIDFFYRHPRVTFVMMGVWFLLFGVSTVNLFVQLKLNLELFLEYGLMVVADGALEQLIDLLASTYFGMAFYLLFKVNERILVERLAADRLAKRQLSAEQRQ